jgi:hypothetical protein
MQSEATKTLEMDDDLNGMLNAINVVKREIRILQSHVNIVLTLLSRLWIVATVAI